MTASPNGNTALSLCQQIERGDLRALGILLRQFSGAIAGSSNGGFVFESATDNIAALGTTQTAAVQLTAELNRVTTATAGSAIGVRLPTGYPGLTILVVNHSGTALQVFGNGSDTINDVATATGVTHMNSSVVLYTCYGVTAGVAAWYSEGLATGYSGAFQTLSFTPTVAAAGTTQGAATNLTTMINRVSSATTGSATGVRLPASVPGMEVLVINKASVPIQVYGAGTDTINAIATATGISQGINTAALYVCDVAGNWEVPITTLQSSTPQPITASGAIAPHTGHTYVITQASASAQTLAAPTAGTDDGIEITVTSASAYAHTITATGLLNTGSASVNTATFAAFAGAGLCLMAYNGKWNVISQIGITFS